MGKSVIPNGSAQNSKSPPEYFGIEMIKTRILRNWQPTTVALALSLADVAACWSFFPKNKVRKRVLWALRDIRDGFPSLGVLDSVSGLNSSTASQRLV